MDNDIQDLLTQQTQADLQRQQSGVQQSGGSAQAGVEQPQSATSFSQDDLLSPVLRVEGSETTIQNTTSINPSAQPAVPDYANAAWLWLLVPVVLTIILFWPRKSKPGTVDASASSRESETGTKQSQHLPEIVRPLNNNDKSADPSIQASKKKTKRKKRKHSR